VLLRAVPRAAAVAVEVEVVEVEVVETLSD
jgi:hypothetical protein